MIIKPKTNAAKKLQGLFLDLLEKKGYRNLYHFCKEHNLVHRKVYQRIFYCKNIHLDHVNEYIALFDKERKIIIFGDDVRIVKN